MSLRYVGKIPVEQTRDVVIKQYADTYAEANSVSGPWLIEQADLARSAKISQDTVDAAVNAMNGQTRQYPTRNQVIADQARYLDVALLGNPQVGAQPGVARATGTKLTFANHIPSNISRDNSVIAYDAIAQAGSYEGATYLSSTYVATTNNDSEYRAATFTIPDPGFAYYPINMVYIKGKASGTASSRTSGTNNMGKINVSTPVSPGPQVFYASGICAATPYENYYAALPHTPQHVGNLPVRPPNAITGKLTLNIHLSNYQGSGYTFYSTGLMWSILVVPVVGN